VTCGTCPGPVSHFPASTPLFPAYLSPHLCFDNVPTRPVASTASPNAAITHLKPLWSPTPEEGRRAAASEAEADGVHREGGHPARAERAPCPPGHGQPGLEGVLQRQGLARPVVHREPADRARHRPRDALGRRRPAQGRPRGVSRCAPARAAWSFCALTDRFRLPGAGMVTCALAELPESVVKKIIVMEEPAHFGTLMRVCPRLR
jgi:hypothetical protein